jgi:hypothetical protein
VIADHPSCGRGRHLEGTSPAAQGREARTRGGAADADRLRPTATHAVVRGCTLARVRVTEPAT